MRKIISAILCVILTFSLICVNAQNALELSVDTDHLNVVKNLGILDGFANYDTDSAYITRGEFAAVITRLINMGDLGATEERFADVSPNHAYYNQIMTANMLGIMVGDENGNFMPDKSVTYPQAVKCLMYILGYSVYAEKSGGYPIGYAIQAQRLDILDNTGYKEDALISRSALAQMIYNCLDVELIDFVAVEKGAQQSEKQGETILSRYLDVRKFEAVLSSIDGRSFITREKDTDEGMAKFGSTVLKYDDATLHEYLGYRMEVYATQSGEEKLIYAFPTNKNSELVIAASDLLNDVSDFSLTKIYYEAQDGKTLSANLTASHRFMYNGAYDYDFDLPDFNITTGYVKMIDHDNDDVYDVCMVWDFENFVLKSVSDNLVTCHYNKTLKKGDEDVSYRVQGSDGAWGDWDELFTLVNWDVLSVAKSKDQKLVTIYSTRSGTGGTVEAISNDGQTKAQINGYDYVISEQYLNMPANSGYIPIKAGLRSEFYFDICGEIAAVYKAGGADNEYGYLMNAAPVSAMSKKYQVKLFDQNGKIQIYDIGEKVKFSSGTIEEKSYKTADVIAQFDDGVGNFVPQMICYSANDDGLVTQITQFTDATALGYNLDKFSMDVDCINVSEEYNFQNSTSSFIHESSYDKVFHIGGSTKVFYIPVENGEAIEENMQIVDASVFNNNNEYTSLQAYDCDDTYTAAVLLYMPDSTNSDVKVLDSYLFAVNKVYVGKDQNGEMQNMVSGMLRGVEEEFVYISVDGSVPEKGSIIQCQKTLKGELKIHKDYVIYSPAKGAILTPRTVLIEEQLESQLPKVWVQTGILYRKNGSAISVDVGASRPWAGYLNKPTVYKYSEEEGKFVTANEGILIPSTGNPVDTPDGSLMVLNYCYHYIREIFVIEE